MVLAVTTKEMHHTFEYRNYIHEHKRGINFVRKPTIPPARLALRAPVYSVFRMRPSPGFTRCAHSVQLPSYNRLCCVGKPASDNAASMIAAVTPVPQLLMIGLDGSTPLDLKMAWSSEAGRRVLSFGSRRSVMGTEVE